MLEANHCIESWKFTFIFVSFHPQRISISPGDRGGRTPDSKKMKKDDSDGERSDQVSKQSEVKPLNVLVLNNPIQLRTLLSTIPMTARRMGHVHHPEKTAPTRKTLIVQPRRGRLLPRTAAKRIRRNRPPRPELRSPQRVSVE